MISDLQGQIWLDGTFCDWKDAKIHILTHTLHYGTGVFEGVRAYETEQGPAIFRLQDHTSRLFKSAELIGMNIPYSKTRTYGSQCESVKINKLKNAYKRAFMFLWKQREWVLEQIILKCMLHFSSWDWGAYLGEDKIKKESR
ncbi:MAG: hypothetical protein Ct9H90mP18_00380 [Gammaproteobacteria bacterium]|nr:MAG: hypothetical protein Ct9H90mP18_00380 [Gammaproteobacteria bacterium]